jgi:hypothetical protein
MTLDQLIDRLTSLKQSGWAGDTQVFTTTEGDGTWLISGVYEREDEQENYPADWNMPDQFLDITT